MPPHRHPPQATEDPPSSSTHVSASPTEDDTLNVPSRDVEQTVEEAGISATPDDDTTSAIPIIGQEPRRRGLDHNRVEDLTIVDGRYAHFYIFEFLYFLFT